MCKSIHIYLHFWNPKAPKLTAFFHKFAANSVGSKTWPELISLLIVHIYPTSCDYSYVWLTVYDYMCMIISDAPKIPPEVLYILFNITYCPSKIQKCVKFTPYLTPRDLEKGFWTCTFHLRGLLWGLNMDNLLQVPII